MFYTHKHRDCTGRHGRIRRGPFSMSWDFDFGGGPRGRGRSRRRFDSGELQLLLLKLIADTPRHGYDLIREIEERTGGAYAPSPGVIYPTLTLLEEIGHIAPEASEGPRKAYAATAEGLAHLEARAGDVSEILARLDAMGQDRAETERGSMRRAMTNLAQVLANKRASGAFDGSLENDIADLIDEAARKIERL